MWRTVAALILTLTLGCRGAPPAPQAVERIDPDVLVESLGDGIYLHRSWKDLPGFGRSSSNGLLVVGPSGSVLIDTAWNDAQTKVLLDFASQRLRAPVRDVVVTHTHEDRMGGLGAAVAAGAKPHALAVTLLRARRQGISLSAKALPEDGAVELAGRNFRMFFPGPGHAPDNLVVFPSGSNVVFAGCLARYLNADGLGNLADADLAGWPQAIERLRQRLPPLARVVPGHGEPGGEALLDWTEKLLDQAEPRRAGPALELTPQLPHAGAIRRLALSPDGALAATAAEESTVKLWDLKSGLLLRTLRAHDARVAALAFLPDGERLVSIDADHELIVWKVGSSVPERRFEVGPQEVFDLLALPDGKSVVIGGRAIRVFDLETGQVSASADSWGKLLASSADGARIASGVEWGEIGVWDRGSDAPPRQLRGHPWGETSATPVPILAIALSPDGKRVATGCADGTVELFELDSSEPSRTIQAHTNPVGSVAFSPDGTRLLSAAESTQNEGPTLRLWNLASGGEALGDFGGFSAELHAARFSPDGAHVVAAGDTLTLWDAATGERTSELRRPLVFPVDTVAFSPDGRQALASSTVGDLLLWDLESARLARRFRGMRATSAAFMPDGARALVCSERSGAEGLWLIDLGSGERVRRFEGAAPRARSIAVSPDGRRALTGGDSGGVQVWDLESGALMRVLPAVESVRGLAFSSDGRLAAVGGAARPVQLWDVEKGSLERAFEDSNDYAWPPYAKAVALSPHGELIAATSGLMLWDARSGRRLGSIDACSQAMAVSTDGKRAVTGCPDGLLEHWDLEVGARLSSFRLHEADILSVAISPDGRRALSASQDGTLRLWDLKTGASLTMLADLDDWLVASDEGFFDASRGGGRLAAAVLGHRALRVEQLAARANRPDRLLERMGLGAPELIAHQRARAERRLRQLGLADGRPSLERAPTARIAEAQVDGRFVDLQLELSDPAGLLSYNLWANGVPLFGASGKPVEGTSQRVSERVELGRGETRLELTALNKDGTESLREERAFQIQAPRGDFYFVGFGVSAYRRRGLALGHAHEDALDLAEIFRSATGFARVNAQALTDYQVTRERVATARRLLSRARVDDTVVLFFAGQRACSTDPGAGCYLLGWDSDPDRLAETAISFEAIEALLASCPARRKLLIVDANGANELDETPLASLLSASTERGLIARVARKSQLSPLMPPPSGPGRALLLESDRCFYEDLAARSGASVLTSTRGAEASYERNDLHNGVFAAELIAALGNEACDADGDGSFSLEELAGCVSQAVARSTGDLQHPTLVRENLEAHLRLPRIGPKRPRGRQ